MTNVDDEGVANMLWLLIPLTKITGVTCKIPNGALERVYVKTNREWLDPLYRDTFEYTKGGAFEKVIDLQQVVVADTLVAVTAFSEFPAP